MAKLSCVTVSDFLVGEARLRPFAGGDLPPLMLVELAALRADARLDSLPPCPVIGIGDSAHPLAARLDCVVEPPIGLEGLVASVCANPVAASVLVQLLRLIAGMAPAEALVAESLAYATLQGGGEHAAWLAAQEPAPPAAPGKLDIVRDDGVLRMTTRRGHAANAIDVALRDALREALELASLDTAIRRVEWRGEGKAFGVGADLGEFGTTRDPARAHLIRMRTLPALAAIGCMDRMFVELQGLCVGASLELAAFAARIEAQRSAIFHLPELKMGLLPGAGGSVSVSRRIGRQRAALMILSGRRIGAQTALEWGLVDAIVD